VVFVGVVMSVTRVLVMLVLFVEGVVIDVDARVSGENA